MRLPEPMLARSELLPTGAGWAFEPKFDGFRALLDTHHGLRARSRRGWDMTSLLPELEALPVAMQLDGELVAWDENGHPDFHRLSRRMLHGDRSIGVCFVAFDLLGHRGESLIHLTYAERRRRLEAIALDGPTWRTAPAFGDGEAVWRTVLDYGLEGVVAKRLRDRYRPGERGWIKRKNPHGPRFEEERAASTRLTTRRKRKAAHTVASPEERKGLNEAKFREANERLEAGAREIVGAEDASPVPFLCECPRMDCTHVVLLTLAEYEYVRGDGSRGMAVPGHQDETVERVVSETDRFVVTEKFGPAGEVVKESDPRS